MFSFRLQDSGTGPLTRQELSSTSALDDVGHKQEIGGRKKEELHVWRRTSLFNSLYGWQSCQVSRLYGRGKNYGWGECRRLERWRCDGVVGSGGGGGGGDGAQPAWKPKNALLLLLLCLNACVSVLWRRWFASVRLRRSTRVNALWANFSLKLDEKTKWQINLNLSRLKLPVPCRCSCCLLVSHSSLLYLIEWQWIASDADVTMTFPYDRVCSCA